MRRSSGIAVAFLVQALLLISYSVDAQNIYQCKAKSGKIEYRDYPCDGPQPQVPPKASGARSGDSRNFDARTGLPTTRAVYDQMLDACLALLAGNPKARKTEQWTLMRCDRIEEFEIWRSSQSGVDGVFAVESSENDEVFVINGRKYRAKTYCYGLFPGARVKFIEGSSVGDCDSAKIVNLNRDQVCSLWCE